MVAWQRTGDSEALDGEEDGDGEIKEKIVEMAYMAIMGYVFKLPKAKVIFQFPSNLFNLQY